MDRRVNELKQKKRRLKNEVKRNDNKLYQVFVGSLIFGILNWFIWYNQYLNEGILYDIVFIFLPILLGMVFFYFKFNAFVKYYSDTKSILDKIGCCLLLCLMGIMISFASFGTLSNIIYKSLMDFSIKDKPTEIKSYDIDRFIYGSDRSRINRFSTVEYHYASERYGNFKLDKFGRNDSKMIEEFKNLTQDEIKKMKLILYTKEGFWGIKKIIKYKVN